MEKLKRLQENIMKLIDANYPDDAADDIVAECMDLRELNDFIEAELSYAAEV